MARDLHSPRYVRLRELLIAARKEAGLTQTELARKLGRPQSYIADLERGERRIDVIDYLTMASSLTIDPLLIISDLMLIIE